MSINQALIIKTPLRQFWQNNMYNSDYVQKCKILCDSEGDPPSGGKWGKFATLHDISSTKNCRKEGVTGKSG